MRRKPTDQDCLQECERSFSALISAFLKDHSIDRWVIAHSGGLDSQVLLHLAAKRLHKRELFVVHVNHQLQVESDGWAAFSKQQTAALGLDHHICLVSPESASEADARSARYAALEALLNEGDCVLFGHHADDQAETILFRMLRGSGIKGLQGMPTSRVFANALMLRPLLKLPRSVLEGAARALQLAYIEDPSNKDDRYDRNFLRLNVIPHIKQRWPDVTMRWQQSAEVLAASDQLMRHYLECDLEVCVAVDGSLDLCKWLALPDIRRPELLRFWILQATGKTLNRRQISAIINDLVMAKEDASPVFKRQGVEIRRFQQCLHIVKTVTGCASEMSLSKALSQGMGDGRLSVEGELPSLSWQDAVVRRRAGGERCRPIGLSHSVTVKKLLQEASIPPWHRARWPLVFIGDELAAVPGVCLCQGFDAEKSGFSLLWHPF